MFTVYFMLYFIVRVVCEREYENLRSYWRPSGFREKIREKLSREVSHVQSTWLECEESWQLIFASNSQVGPSCEIHAKYSVLLFWHIYFTMSSPTLFIPSLPIYFKECFSDRKPYKLPLRVRDCYIHNHLHNPLWFSLTPTSSYPYPWKVDSLNTYHNHFKCKARFWCCWEALKDKVSSSQLVAGAWRAQLHGVD